MRRLVFFIIVAVVLPILGAELVLRWFVHVPAHESSFVLDYDLGWKLRPSTKFQFSQEGNGVVETNAEGFRDYLHRVEKPESSFRVALIGDSFFEAKQVNYEESLAALLEQKLSECKPNVAVEVFNFSAQGYATLQQYVLYTNYVAKYSPDVVVLGFYEGNDVYDNHPKLNPSNPELAPYLQQVVSLDQGKLKVASGQGRVLFYARKVLHEASRYSFIARKLFSLLANIGRAAPAHSKQQYEWTLFRAPLGQELVEAWSITLDTLKAFRNLVVADGAKFRLLSIPSAIAVHPDEHQQQLFKRTYGIADFSYASKRLQSVINDVEFLDLQKEFVSRLSSRGAAFYGFANSRPGFGHWNQLGHQAVAEYLAAELCFLASQT